MDLIKKHFIVIGVAVILSVFVSWLILPPNVKEIIKEVTKEVKEIAVGGSIETVKQTLPEICFTSNGSTVCEGRAVVNLKGTTTGAFRKLGQSVIIDKVEGRLIPTTATTTPAVASSSNVFFVATSSAVTRADYSPPTTGLVIASATIATGSSPFILNCCKDTGVVGAITTVAQKGDLAASSSIILVDSDYLLFYRWAGGGLHATCGGSDGAIAVNRECASASSSQALGGDPQFVIWYHYVK